MSVNWNLNIYYRDISKVAELLAKTGEKVKIYYKEPKKENKKEGKK